ncbi:FCD domain-containing protein [Sphingomonas sp.]|uniref:FCD domain-containing protein n=1 Tax=Sphingomonas sp. TaxID=28214 RepID=UPI0031D325C3
MMPVKSNNGVVDHLVEAIEALIAEQRLAPGQRLPSERTLAERLGASRGSLREAILRLSGQGRLSVGKRGSVITIPDVAPWAQSTIATPLGALVATDPGYARDVLETRLGLEGQAAYHAALRARAEDRDEIRRSFDAMLASHTGGDPAAEAQADAAFHLSIARASHNAVLHSVMSSMFLLLRASISESLAKLYTVPRTCERLSEQHHRLMDAILAGDAEGARDASDEHIGFIEATIRSVDEERARVARAAALHSPLGQ